MNTEIKKGPKVVMTKEDAIKLHECLKTMQKSLQDAQKSLDKYNEALAEYNAIQAKWDAEADQIDTAIADLFTGLVGAKANVQISRV